MRIYRLIRFSSIIAFCALLFSACDQDPIVDTLTGGSDDFRGKLVSTELIGSFSIEQIDSIIFAINGAPPELTFLAKEYPVDIYKVIYETIDAKGQPTIASGALSIPRDIEVPNAWVSYQHGTVIRKDNVPSRGSQEMLIGAVYASASGVVVSQPDYLGLGDSPGRHPYVHGVSQATAAIDMMRAGQAICAEKEITLNDKLMLFGYSQGGHATMALHKQLQENYADEFVVTASYPMAGPYDLSGYQAATFTDGLPYANKYYLPYLLLSYNEVYDLYDSPSDFLKSPYDQTLPPLFDGLNSGGTINQQIPNIPSDIIRDDLIENFKYNYNHPFRQALRDNDLWDWYPEAPVRLCHCTGDTQVFYENALVAYNSFLDKGKTDIELITPNDGDHEDCVLPCFLNGIGWFSEFY